MATAVAISVDEFQALEEKVLRAVEIVRYEREGRLTAEAEVARLKAQLAEQAALTVDAADTVRALEKERGDIRKRVEKMLEHMDELL